MTEERFRGNQIISNQPHHLSDFPATALDFLAAATAAPSEICLVSEKHPA